MPRDLIKFRADVAQAWSLAGPGAKVGVVSLLIFTGFWAFMFASVAFYRTNEMTAGTKVGLPLFSLSCAYAVAALGLELSRLILRAGWYASPSRWHLFGRRLAGCLLTAFIGLVASIVVSIIVQGPTGG